MRVLLIALLLLGLLAPLTALRAETGGGAGQSQTQPAFDKRKLLVQPRNADGSVRQTAFFDDPVLWVRDKQSAYYGAISGALRRLKTDAPLAAGSTLMLLSFGYGIFHAAGPGHGKAVISAWLLATETELRRGILIAFMSSAIQALTAIAIVSLLLALVSAVGSTARDVAGFLESASYGLIGLAGLYLMWSAMRARRTSEAGHRDEHVHGPHHHDHGHADHSQHGGDESCHCGHAHLPAAREVKQDWSLAKASALAFSVGIRPCTGAILALVFANAAGLYWAGIASTFAMALGTAITVSVIAALAVYAKKIAVTLARGDPAWLDRMVMGLRLGGGAAIAALGGLLFWGSLGTVNAMM